MSQTNHDDVVTRLSAVLGAAPVGALLLDAAGRVLAANPRGREICGWSATEEVAGRVASDAWRVTAEPPGARLVASGEEVELSVVAVPESGGLSVTWLRVRESERRAAELDRQLRTLLQNLPGMAYRCANDRDWTMTFVSDGAIDLTGYPAADFIDGVRTFASVIHPDDEPVVWEQIQSAVVQQEPFRLAYRIRTRHGQERWCWEQGEGVRGPDGELLALEGFIVDITAERTALEAAHASRAYLATVLDSLTEAVCATDESGRVTLFNPAGARITGVPVEEALGRWPEEVFLFVEREGGRLAPSPLDASPPGERHRDAILDRRGDKHLLCYAVTELRGAPGAKVLVARDITLQADLEEQLRQATKMEAIGRLAGGIAHDFNNLLTGIMGYSDLLHEELQDRPQLAEYAETVLETARRAAELTGQLLAFGRRRRLGREVVDLHGVIRDVVALFSRAVDPLTAVETRCDAACALVLGDRSLLQNALLNIALNARDAMPDGGTVVFETALLALRECDAQLSGDLKPGLYVEIRILDDGAGIPPDAMPRLFEPFYSSKAGQGTGLGLATVYGTVTAHRGMVRAENRREGGAVFTVTLPVLADDGAALPGGAGGEAEKIVTGAGRILLGEDDDMVRLLLTTMLTRLGYSVEALPNGRAAVEAFLEDPLSWDLVILDAHMPVMSGEEAFDAIVAAREGGRVLMSSGHRRDLPPRPQMKGFLPKPYDLARLSQMVAHAMND